MSYTNDNYYPGKISYAGRTFRLNKDGQTVERHYQFGVCQWDVLPKSASHYRSLLGRLHTINNLKETTGGR